MMTGRLLPGVAVVVACLAPRVAYAECVETAPATGAHPQMTETFPSRGTSGYDATLHVVIVHGRGETVLPRGLELQSESDAAKALKAAGFALPDQDAGAGARMTTRDLDAQGGRRETTVDLPLVALPSEPGRHSLTLPPVPIVIARASGDVVTLCTKPHSLVVDDPTASTPDAQPRGNPPPRSQREEWVMLERALAWGALGVAVGGVLAWMAYRWTKRPKPVPPPPPPRVPWEVALERLHEVRHAGLLETSRFADFFDRVNDAVRQYLGARFGFDGLESTTDETLAALRRVPSFGIPMPELVAFLEQCDLVKFADLTPTQGECERALSEAERVVRSTMPRTGRPTPPPPAGKLS
jgi:hypothetical protein